MTPYSFVLLRYVHDVGSGEFANVGVVGFSERTGVYFRFSDRYGRLSRFFADFDGQTYRRVIKHVEDQFRGEAERFGQGDLLQTETSGLLPIVHAILPQDDSALQWSPVMGGIAEDVGRRIDELFEELVLRHEMRLGRERRDEHAVQRSVDRTLREAGLLSHVKHDVEIRAEDYEYSFYAGWSNGSIQVLEPISFDFVNPADMIEKANTWSGRLLNLARQNDFRFTAVVARPTEDATLRKLDRALSILRKAPTVRAVFLEEDVAEIGEIIRKDVGS